MKLFTNIPIIHTKSATSVTDGYDTDKNTVPSSSGKKPWEMTRSETEDILRTGDKNDVPKLQEVLRALRWDEGYSRANDPWGTWRTVHVGDELPRVPLVELSRRRRAMIQEAISRGETVPDHVLSELGLLKHEASQGGVKLFTQIDCRLTRTAQSVSNEQEDEGETPVTDKATEEKPVGMHFELRLSTRLSSVENMLAALDDADIQYEEESLSRWRKQGLEGVTLKLGTADDVLKAAIILSKAPYSADSWSPVMGGSSPAVQKRIHVELEDRIGERRRDELYGEMWEKIELHKESILNQFLSTGTFEWPKLPEERIFRIWNDYADIGFVRDEKGMADIAYQTIDIVARMSASNNLSGHDTVSDLEDMMEDKGYEKVGREQWSNGEKTIDMSDLFWNSELHSSDYSMGDLQAAAILLMNASTPEEQLTYVDRILNTVHQSSDLSLAFLKNGQKFLGKLYGAGKLWHGTRIEKSGMDIASSGELQPGAQATGRGFTSPVGEKVYITKSLQTAIMHALGADMAGHDLPESFIGKDGRYGYIFEVDNDDRSVMQPDEVAIGELICSEKAPLWLLVMLNRFVAPSRIERLKRGERAYFASVGKQLLARMDDFRKAEILKLVPNFALQRPIKVLRGWRIDKKNSISLLRDGSNFFEYAEEVRIGNRKAV